MYFWFIIVALNSLIDSLALYTFQEQGQYNGERDLKQILK